VSHSSAPRHVNVWTDGSSHSVAKGAASPWPPLDVRGLFESHYVGIVAQGARGREYLLIFKKPTGARPEDFEGTFQEVTVQGQDLNTLKIFPGHARATAPLIPNKSLGAIAAGQYQVTDCIDISLPPIQDRSGLKRPRSGRTVGVRLGPPLRPHRDSAFHFVSIQVREGSDDIYAGDFRVDRSRFALAFVGCDEADEAGSKRQPEAATIIVSHAHTPDGHVTDEPAHGSTRLRPNELGSRSPASLGSDDVSHGSRKAIDHRRLTTC
jgi:hypothetical protein